MSKAEVNEAVWKIMKDKLGYTEEESKKFKNNPRNVKIMKAAETLMNKTIIFEVAKSHGCNIEHKIGDKFYFSAEGYMLAHQGPKKVCPFILPTMARLVWVIQERIYEGLDPQPSFNFAHCEDVGIDCGGWGRVVIEAKGIERQP